MIIQIFLFITFTITRFLAVFLIVIFLMFHFPRIFVLWQIDCRNDVGLAAALFSSAKKTNTNQLSSTTNTRARQAY